MLGSLAYVVLISTELISKITVKHISTILRLIFVDSDNPAQRKRCEFSKSYRRAAMTTMHLISYSQSFCRTIATIRNFAKLQPLSNVNPLVFLISLWARLRAGKSFIERPIQHLYPLEPQCDTKQRTEATDLDPKAKEFRPVRKAAAAGAEEIRLLAEEEEEYSALISSPDILFP